jgi:hypothetical protein
MLLRRIAVNNSLGLSLVGVCKRFDSTDSFAQRKKAYLNDKVTIQPLCAPLTCAAEEVVH